MIDLTLIFHILQVEIKKRAEYNSSCRYQISASARQEKVRDKEQTAANTVRTGALTELNATMPCMALYEPFANGDPTVTKMIKPQKQQSPVVSEPG
ncbi:hypothetical protein [Pseudomonas lactis]|uniref:Uncharacterized protein n=1 Tax=Pseudomonas lactis TaxID=1615674 RepID=A0A7Y1MIM2_9PSED|nr:MULTISPECIES: hypothetical protein [Pseudomonas]KRP75788.1 hypothetical protein TX24_26015 [Pseudomonas lactis]NNA76611.1 hypothetical protein [Pseudomonas lactis]NNA82420.1 hypothetical protein [Pseudomonas lactis]